MFSMYLGVMLLYNLVLLRIMIDMFRIRWRVAD
jgi:hypothetical protein